MGSGRRSKKRRIEESNDESLSSGDSSEYSRRSSKTKHRRKSDGGSRREKERRKYRREERDRERKRRHRRDKKKTRDKNDHDSDSDSDSDSSSVDCRHDSESEERRRAQPAAVVEELLNEFPAARENLKQILEMIDNGQAVDIKGISEKSLVKHLKKLFAALRLKESGDRVFSLSPKARPTLEVVGPMLRDSAEIDSEQLHPHVPSDDVKPAIDHNVTGLDDKNVGPSRRVIGPTMPSAELLAAAAKFTEAQAELREAELEEDDEIFVGPPPPALVAEAASANEAERFEEVTRIMGCEDVSVYEILGVNQNRTAENIKKRYWKISLLVHPDKCPHPQAHQAFIKLNKAFKELQDPEKKKALDEKLKEKEEMEKFKIELRAMREAAQWRRSQGISMEGDDELLAEEEIKVAPQREEWMTSLPPERRPAVSVPTQSTRAFSKGGKEGRGDTSAWTDTPSDRAQKAKINYLEAYNEAAELISNEARRSSDADLVDKYNREKRSKSLVEKHQEEKKVSRSSKKKSVQRPEKEEWVGEHPWKPWDREKDLTAGRKSVNLDPKNMSQGLTSRFSSGSFQRNFL